MTWFKVDDGFHSHAKAITAGTPALGLWVRCGSWSANHLRNGHVPVNVAREFGSASQIKSLVSAGLWAEVDGGYQFNDWEDYNPTAEDVKADRAAAKERQRRAREAAKAKRDAERSSGEVTDLSRRDNAVSHGPVTSPRPDPTRPEGSKEPSSAEPPREDVEAICQRLADRINEHVSKPVRVIDSWRKDARKLLDLDKRPIEEAFQLIDWCQADSFWQPNILSMAKFRQKYEQLRLKSRSQGQKAAGQRLGPGGFIRAADPDDDAWAM